LGYPNKLDVGAQTRGTGDPAAQRVNGLYYGKLIGALPFIHYMQYFVNEAIEPK
jgi:hypothetical protein